MPGNAFIFNTLGIILQYLLVILIYYFLFQVIKVIYTDLKSVGFCYKSKPAVTPKVLAKLMVIESSEGSLLERIYEFADALTIGRADTNDIVISDTFVSYEHACISLDKSGYWLSDLKSTNGTYLNGERITEDILLKSGDVVKIGWVAFRFERGDR